MKKPLVNKILDELYFIEYQFFKEWMSKYPKLKDPEIALTSGVARDFARVVYEQVNKKSKGERLANQMLKYKLNEKVRIK